MTSPKKIIIFFMVFKFLFESKCSETLSISKFYKPFILYLLTSFFNFNNFSKAILQKLFFMIRLLLISLLIISSTSSFSQILQDDFEGNSTITWNEEDIIMTLDADNPFSTNSSNTSGTALKYVDNGTGNYANIYFDSSRPIILEENTPFDLMIYIPGSSITGNQPNQISLKLQNKNRSEPWTTQTEIIKSVTPNNWQTITFDFATDDFINYNENSPDPLSRIDFNRVVLQVNGENNTDAVTAYIDNFYFEGGEDPTTPGNPNDPVYDQLVWSDEFNTNGTNQPLNSENWFHQTKLPQGGSWFNGEIQHYTDRTENSYVENGKMHLVAKKETFTNQGVTKQYTSARLNSKFAFTYGKVQVRAKLPTGVGTWPAIWMLGKNITETGGYWSNEGFGTTPWPACGEIDIMEHWGDNQNYVSSAMHTPSSYGGTINTAGQIVPTASTEFHIYTLEWYEDRMVFSVDGDVHYTYNPTVKNDQTWPFDKDQYILLNTAIEPSIESGFTESAMEIDYVRVYQESSLSTDVVADESKLTISPNPVNQFTTLINEGFNNNQTLEVYTIQGRLKETYSINDKRTRIDMSGWSAGVYLFKIKGSTNNQTYKIIKL